MTQNILEAANVLGQLWVSPAEDGEVIFIVHAGNYFLVESNPLRVLLDAHTAINKDL